MNPAPSDAVASCWQVPPGHWAGGGAATGAAEVAALALAAALAESVNASLGDALSLPADVVGVAGAGDRPAPVPCTVELQPAARSAPAAAAAAMPRDSLRRACGRGPVVRGHIAGC